MNPPFSLQNKETSGLLAVLGAFEFANMMTLEDTRLCCARLERITADPSVHVSDDELRNHCLKATAAARGAAVNIDDFNRLADARKKDAGGDNSATHPSPSKRARTVGHNQTFV